MARYKYFDKSQGLFLTVSFEEQLIPGSFEHTVNYLIDQLDLSSFDAAFHNDHKGLPPIPPGDAQNIVVKVLARDAEPDHDTIAHFISSQAEAVKGLFAQLLLKCYALGLIGGELFAIDGCKLPSNAANERPGTLEE
jgi:hypothetical protein